MSGPRPSAWFVFAMGLAFGAAAVLLGIVAGAALGVM